MTSMRRNDVASTSHRRHVPNRFLINQCQIITFLTLKYDIIENSRIELRGIVLPVQVGGLLGGGGPKGVLAPPLKLLGGLAPPLPTPMCITWIPVPSRWIYTPTRYMTQMTCNLKKNKDVCCMIRLCCMHHTERNIQSA